MIENDGSSRAVQAPRRVARPAPPVLGAAILADCSTSMDARDGQIWGSDRLVPRRIDRLAKVLDYLLTRVRVQRLICFADLPVEVPLVGRIQLLEPAGSTALHVALDYVAALAPRPSQLFVLSDGVPNSIDWALEAAQRLRPMVIDAYYVGPDNDADANRFMAKLAAAGSPGGRSGHFDMIDPVLLGTELKNRLLAGPTS